MGWEVGDGRAHFQLSDQEVFLEEVEFELGSEDGWEMNERGPEMETQVKHPSSKSWGVGRWMTKGHTILIWYQDRDEDLSGDVFQKFRL